MEFAFHGTFVEEWSAVNWNVSVYVEKSTHTWSVDPDSIAVCPIIASWRLLLEREI